MYMLYMPTDIYLATKAAKQDIVLVLSFRVSVCLSVQKLKTYWLETDVTW